MNPEQEQSNPIADAIFKALAYTENGGKPDIKKPSAGKTGEMASVFQFTPSTWKNYSKQVTGADIPISPEAEAFVVHKKIGEWLKKGYEPKQIASMWNAGSGEPDAYKGEFQSKAHAGMPSVGVNKKYGVKYDVPGYVSKFDKYFNEFSNPSNQLAEANKTADIQMQNSELEDRGDKVLSQEAQVDWHNKQNPADKVDTKKGLLADVKKKPNKKAGLLPSSSKPTSALV